MDLICLLVKGIDLLFTGRLTHLGKFPLHYPCKNMLFYPGLWFSRQSSFKRHAFLRTSTHHKRWVCVQPACLFVSKCKTVGGMLLLLTLAAASETLWNLTWPRVSSAESKTSAPVSRRHEKLLWHFEVSSRELRGLLAGLHHWIYHCQVDCGKMKWWEITRCLLLWQLLYGLSVLLKFI